MDKHIRLWVECDNLRPYGLGIIEDTARDDVLIDVAQRLQNRFAQRIADAVGAVLIEDVEVVWENETFEVSVSFHATSIQEQLTSRR